MYISTYSEYLGNCDCVFSRFYVSFLIGKRKKLEGEIVSADWNVTRLLLLTDDDTQWSQKFYDFNNYNFCNSYFTSTQFVNDTNMYRNCLEGWKLLSMLLKTDFVPIVWKLKARYGRAYGWGCLLYSDNCDSVKVRRN